MGIRSEVGVTVKGKLIEKVKNLPILQQRDEFFEQPEGNLWVFRGVKWYLDNAEIKELYAVLETSPEDCLVVEACHEYPENDGGNFGTWDDNPWGLCLNISVSLSYYY